MTIHVAMTLWCASSHELTHIVTLNSDHLQCKQVADASQQPAIQRSIALHQHVAPEMHTIKHSNQPHQEIPHLYLTGFLKQHLAAKGQNAGLVNWMHCAQGTANTRWDLRIFHDLLPVPKGITIVTTALVGLQDKSVSFDFSLLIIIHSPSFITTSVTPW